MMTFLRKHPNAVFYAITFVWSWVLILLLIASGSVKDIGQPTPAFILVGLLCNLSPSAAAFSTLRVTQGKTGTQALRQAFCKKAKRGQLLFSLLALPVVTVLAILLSSRFVHGYTATLTIPLIFVGLVWPLFSGFGEEFGWRGYILPQLLKKHSPLVSGLMLGLIWSVWHIPMDYIGYQTYGAWMIPAYLVSDFAVLTVHSLIMTHLFVKSGGNVKLMVLYHYTITATAILPGAFLAGASEPKLSVLDGMISVGLLAVLAAVLYVRDAVQKRQGSAPDVA